MSDVWKKPIGEGKTFVGGLISKLFATVAWYAQETLLSCNRNHKLLKHALLSTKYNLISDELRQ